MTTRRPRLCKVATALAAPGLGSSVKASKTTACAASLASKRSNAETVAPCACSRSSAATLTVTPSSEHQRRLASAQPWPAMSPRIPRPGNDRSASSACGVMPRRAAASVTARASGCALPLCRPAAMESHSISSSAPSRGTSRSSSDTSAVSTGRPSVKVPVLSNATVSTRRAISSALASFTRMPRVAAMPVPAITATGVARPSAQGQAITSTATAWINATSTPSP